MSDRLLQFRRSYLKAPTFAQRAYNAVEALHREESRWPRLPDVKELLEEVLPLAMFVSALDRQEQRVRCRYYGGNHAFDAKIRIEGAQVEHGFLMPEYHVEITSAVSPTEYLQREALAKEGMVFPGPNVRRVGRKANGARNIESHLEVRHSDAARHDLTSRIVGAVRKKLEKQYPNPIFLVVRAEADAILKPWEWYELAISTTNSLAGLESFDAVFVVQTSDGHVLQVR